MDQIESRKDEHVRIALEENVEASYNYWDDVERIIRSEKSITFEDAYRKAKKNKPYEQDL